MNKNSNLDLEHFLNRTSMYIYPVERFNIISFIHGYETGIQNTDITSEIKNYLIKKYNINPSNQGWWGQIEDFYKINKIEWIEAFKRIMEELIK